MDDHQFWEEEIESVGELSAVCSQMVLKCFYLARIGRPKFLWSVNKLARAVKKWTKSCDKRLVRLILHTHHTSAYRHFCYVGNTAQKCRLVLFQDTDFAGDLVDSKSISGGILCNCGSHTFVPISWMCKKQTLVSHSSTEAIEEEEDPEDSNNPAAGTWYYKGEPVAQNSKAWVQQFAHGASSSVDKSKGYRSDMGPLPSNIAGHIAL